MREMSRRQALAVLVFVTLAAVGLLIDLAL